MTNLNLKLAFSGAVRHLMDSKRRISIPADFRKAIEPDSRAMIIRHCTPANYIEFILDESPLISDETIQFIAPFLQDFPAIDGNGRISVSKEIRDFLEITNNEKCYLRFFGRGESFGLCKETDWETISNFFKEEIHRLIQRP